MPLRVALIDILHFANAQAMAGMVPLPGGLFFVYLTGVALILASVGILTGKKTSPPPCCRASFS
jgi:putative oxidoreductase